MNNLQNLTINQIAAIIRMDWKKVNFAAKPYLNAMLDIVDVNEKYGFDDARGIILYFLGNATSWRGDVAKAVKAELKHRLKR